MEIPAMKIKTIYFRCQQENSDFGHYSKFIFGEDCFNVGDLIDVGKFITEISTGNITYGNSPFAQVFVNGNLWCEIHESSVTRVYYDITA
jgi:hypothetical protein